MKKTIGLIFCFAFFFACNNNSQLNFEQVFLRIKEAKTPTSFTFGKKDTIKLKYVLPSGCYSFNNIYYEKKDSTRIVAVLGLHDLESNCTQALIDEEYDLIVEPLQKEDYIFKFWKGKDNKGENIFEEVVIPVN